MAFNVVLILAPGNAALLDDALRRWPDARGRAVGPPFGGIALSSDDLTKGAYDDMQRKHELAFDMQDGLPAFSGRHPEVPFVLLEADCFGGNCCYDGIVCRDGEVVRRETGEDALERLLAALGITAAGRHFAPLTRGYFD